MTNKMISNSDILLDLFNNKEYSFLQEIDKKYEILESYKKYLLKKENEISELLEDYNVENERKEKVFKYINKLNEKINDFETRIKELNQAIIRLIVDKGTEYKYQTQDVKQTVCFVKDKIKEYMSLEEKYNKELEQIDTKFLNIIDGKEEEKEDSIKKKNELKKEIKKDNLETQEIKQEETVEVPRRIRQGSALNEIKALNEIEKKTQKEVKKELDKIEEEDTKYGIENNILLISEKVGKIFLPYKKEDIQGYLASYPNEYKDYSEVIEKEYILPLDEFMKNQTLSRFREMYDLIRNKELKSMVEAMKVSTKFMFRYELNPAIIAACNSKSELDNYLDCLEQNRLEEFESFDIKYELNLL